MDCPYCEDLYPCRSVPFNAAHSTSGMLSWPKLNSFMYSNREISNEIAHWYLKFHDLSWRHPGSTTPKPCALVLIVNIRLVWSSPPRLISNGEVRSTHAWLNQSLGQLHLLKTRGAPLFQSLLCVLFFLYSHFIMHAGWLEQQGRNVKYLAGGAVWWADFQALCLWWLPHKSHLVCI
jgi:hypothetical protein